jgi:hypothetical protein
LCPRAALAEADQPEQDLARDYLLYRRQIAQDSVGAARECDGELTPVAVTHCLVIGHLASASIPELNQGLLQ